MLNYNDLGHGKVIVLLHGFCESNEIWAHYEPELAKFSRVINVDLPGFGSSHFEPECRTIVDMAKSVLFLLDELKIERFSIIGHSLGGYVALELVNLKPQRVDSFVLFHSTAFPDSSIKKESRDKVHEFVLRNGLQPFMDSFVAPLFAERNRDKCQKDILLLTEIGKKSNQEAVLSTILAMKNRPDRRDVLVSFQKPILMIVGNEDLAVPIADSLFQIELSFNIQSIVLKDCGHMGMFEKPQTCLSRLLEFYHY